jgi:hypothetical protein
LHHCPSIPRQPPPTMTAINKDHYCRGCHRRSLPSTMTTFALPLPSPSVAFAISVAIAIALAANAIVKKRKRAKLSKIPTTEPEGSPHLASV